MADKKSKDEMSTSSQSFKDIPSPAYDSGAKVVHLESPKDRHESMGD